MKKEFSAKLNFRYDDGGISTQGKTQSESSILQSSNNIGERVA